MTEPAHRVVALLPVYNEAKYLAGWLQNVGDHVSATVALDDGSTDASASLLAADGRFTRVITVRPENKVAWDEPRNREVLTRAGQELGADWFVAFDADERVELRFWRDLPRLLAWADVEDVVAFSFHLREVWDQPDTYRSDGVWGRKRKAAFFRNLAAAHQFDPAQWHGEWVPMQAWETPATRVIDYDLYHLKMLHTSDRAARQQRYQILDPNCDYQALGYSYLTDETDLELTKLDPLRDYRRATTPEVAVLYDG
jgi:hypothetical protein